MRLYSASALPPTKAAATRNPTVDHNYRHGPILFTKTDKAALF